MPEPTNIESSYRRFVYTSEFLVALRETAVLARRDAEQHEREYGRPPFPDSPLPEPLTNPKRR